MDPILQGRGKAETKYLFAISKDGETVDVRVAKDLLEKGHLYLDVRTVEEYNKGHVENALNVSYMFLTPKGRVKNPDFLAQVTSISKKEDHIVVACNSGGRGLRACVDLLNAGFEHVNNMGGGYSAWVDSGFAGEKPPKELKIACKSRG
ncbi:rhodanese-like domain-containing protein 19 [Cucumis melo var. makuwa]|uniref:Rhodanese-like domain-containing protein 19 n=1 Tax=Cucumis melo var. makuwa TaxID=1194695 RepID=A0A5A7VQZ4_CUCMM|nr:rhodanese-like domain-containing protein 19 [Cucumis melo var. makuwa]